MSSIVTATVLPDDPAELKVLLLKERESFRRELGMHTKTLKESELREAQLKQQVRSLLEALRIEKHRLYGSSSEKSPNQTELFDEADAPAEALSNDSEAEETTVSSYQRRKKTTRNQNRTAPQCALTQGHRFCEYNGLYHYH